MFSETFPKPWPPWLLLLMLDVVFQFFFFSGPMRLLRLDGVPCAKKIVRTSSSWPCVSPVTSSRVQVKVTAAR